MQERLSQLQYYRWLIFMVTTIGTFMAVLDANIVSVALPSMAVNLQVELPVLQWVVSAYLLTISSLLPTFGRVGDMYGRRKVYLTGIVIFTAGSLICSFSSTVWFLVGARIIQAIGAAMMMAISPALVSIAFPGKDRGRALGLIGTVVAIAAMVGPSLGGFLVGVFNWQSIFYINLPIGIVAFLMGFLILPRDNESRQEDFDFIGALLFAAGMTGALIVLSFGHEWGWSSYRVLAISLMSVISLSIFVWYELRVQHPMIDLTLFKNWVFLAGNLSGLLAFMAMFANNMLLPFYLHTILLLSPAQIGLAITPYPIMMAIIAPISGYLSERISPPVLTTIGLTIMMSGMLYLATLDAQSAIGHVLISQAIMGFGNGVFQSPNNNSILSSVHPSKVGLASGINALIRNVGMVSGIAVAVSVFETTKQRILSSYVQPSEVEQINAFIAAFHTALYVGAGFAALAAILSFTRRGKYKKLME